MTDIAREKYDDIERRQYEASLKEYWDYTSMLDTAEQKGETKKAKEIAIDMKTDGVPIATIAKYTGLSIEEIERLYILPMKHSIV